MKAPEKKHIERKKDIATAGKKSGQKKTPYFLRHIKEANINTTERKRVE